MTPKAASNSGAFSIPFQKHSVQGSTQSFLAAIQSLLGLSKEFRRSLKEADRSTRCFLVVISFSRNLGWKHYSILRMLSAVAGAVGTIVVSIGDATVSHYVDRVCSKLQGENFQFGKEFQELKKELCYFKAFLKDIENIKRNRRKEILKTIMSELSELVYDAEDIIEDYDLHCFRHPRQKLSKVSSSSSASSLNFSNQMRDQLQEINRSIREIRERMTPFIGITFGSSSLDQDRMNKPLRYPILLNKDELVGIEDSSKKIIRWMQEGSEPFQVIGIVGMGGIGKTTLAQIVYGDTQKHFPLKMFVTVSQTFKLEELIKNMLTKLNIGEASLRGDVRDLLENLRSRLDRKYLIVLDDVWDVVEGLWWESLKSSFPLMNGSCVIVTTRKEQVAKLMGAVEERIHHPKLLSDEDSWSLFSKIAFHRNGGNCPTEDLKKIAKKIVSKCGRLPMAIKIMGGIMLAKGYSIPKWRQISEEIKVGFIAGEKDGQLMSTLELSYEELPAHLKRCLLCFAAYPEDKLIRMSEMVYWWIGEEFVSENNEKTALGVGEEYFVELLNRCLITGVEKDDLEEKFVSCKMHDIVREMIVNIAREVNFITSYDGTRMTDFPSRRACISEPAEAEAFEPNSKLRTLVWIGRYWATLRCELKYLRVIHSATFPRIEGGNWTSSLNHLTYIALGCENYRELPDSFENLHCLRVFVLDAPLDLKRLPPSISTLKKLCVLDVYNHPKCMAPEGLEKLSNLQKLWGLQIQNPKEELKKLTQLAELRFFLRKRDDDIGEVLKVLSDLPRLKILHIQVDSPVELVSHEYGEQVRSGSEVNAHQLCSFYQLEELRVMYWDGKERKIPAWLNPTIFPNLRLLHVGKQMGEDWWRGMLWGNHSAVWNHLEVFSSFLSGFLESHVLRMGDFFEWIEPALPSLRLLNIHDIPTIRRWRKQDGMWTEFIVSLIGLDMYGSRLFHECYH